MKKEEDIQKVKMQYEGIAKKALAAGAKIIAGIEVTGFKKESNSNAIIGVGNIKRYHRV